MHDGELEPPSPSPSGCGQAADVTIAGVKVKAVNAKMDVEERSNLENKSSQL
jgi:hypothetical protein